MKTHSFMSKRIMLPFDIDVYPLTVLSEDAVILGAASEHIHSDSALSPLGGTTLSIDSLQFSTIERTVGQAKQR